MPPLRARAADVLALAQHFIERFGAVYCTSVKGLSSPAAERLVAYPWPGNVRELQNCIERAVALARFEMLSVDDLPEKLRDYRASRVIVESEDPGELLPMEEVERRYVLRALQAVGGTRCSPRRSSDSIDERSIASSSATTPVSLAVPIPSRLRPAPPSSLPSAG